MDVRELKLICNSNAIHQKSPLPGRTQYHASLTESNVNTMWRRFSVARTLMGKEMKQSLHYEKFRSSRLTQSKSFLNKNCQL